MVKNSLHISTPFVAAVTLLGLVLSHGAYAVSPRFTTLQDSMFLPGVIEGISREQVQEFRLTFSRSRSLNCLAASQSVSLYVKGLQIVPSVLNIARFAQTPSISYSINVTGIPGAYYLDVLGKSIPFLIPGVALYNMPKLQGNESPTDVRRSIAEHHLKLILARLQLIGKMRRVIRGNVPATLDAITSTDFNVEYDPKNPDNMQNTDTFVRVFYPRLAGAYVEIKNDTMGEKNFEPLVKSAIDAWKEDFRSGGGASPLMIPLVPYLGNYFSTLLNRSRVYDTMLKGFSLATTPQEKLLFIQNYMTPIFDRLDEWEKIAALQSSLQYELQGPQERPENGIKFGQKFFDGTDRGQSNSAVVQKAANLQTAWNQKGGSWKQYATGEQKLLSLAFEILKGRSGHIEEELVGFERNIQQEATAKLGAQK